MGPPVPLDHAPPLDIPNMTSRKSWPSPTQLPLPCQLTTMMKNPDTPGLLTAKLLPTEQNMLTALTQSQQLFNNFTSKWPPLKPLPSQLLLQSPSPQSLCTLLTGASITTLPKP